MWKRYLIGFSVIALALTLGIFSTGCGDNEEGNEEAPPQTPQQPQEWTQPREQPQQPQQPLEPSDENDDEGDSDGQDSPSW